MHRHVLLAAIIAASTPLMVAGCGGPVKTAVTPEASPAQIEAETARINSNPSIPPEAKAAAIEEAKRRAGATKQ